MSKNNKLLMVVAFIVLIILIITYFKNNNSVEIDEETIRCIASNSHLYVKEGCHYCVEQETILGNYTSLFNITECTQNIEECKNVLGVPFSIPTWIINNQQYIGAKSLNELKSLTGC
ncbi:MAG: hypothetical protein AABX71_03415 [Nanoarchaeota archaeon]